MNEVIFNKPDIFQLLREHQELLVNFGVRRCRLFGLFRTGKETENSDIAYVPLGTGS